MTPTPDTEAPEGGNPPKSEPLDVRAVEVIAHLLRAHENRGIHESRRIARQMLEASSGDGVKVPPATTPAWVDEARSLLQETYGFASTSPRAQENINAVLELLDVADGVPPSERGAA
jgi:hypothetical protein